MKPELLAPAGTPEKLRWAVEYGADAVYFGTKFGSLRNFAGNFTLDEAAEAIEFLHARGKKGYVTLNIYPFTEEYARLMDIARNLDDAGADAFIVADMGVFAQLRSMNLNAKLHISTQANTTSAQAVLAYGQMGASRVNLARELSLERIADIQKQVNGDVETEVFIHGSVCFSYSGRCAISDYLTGFRANRGECKHPCRWKYALVEQERPGEYMPVAEDERGLYFFNSRELSLFEFVPRMSELGVNSLKIEGRNKSIHYIATIVSLYRKLIDGEKISKEQALELLSRVPNRGYSSGFMKGSLQPDDYDIESTSSTSNSIFVGNVLEERDSGSSVVEVRNNIYAGEQLELMTPDGKLGEFEMPATLTTTNGLHLEQANNSQFIVLDVELPAFSVLRRVGSSK